MATGTYGGAYNQLSASADWLKIHKLKVFDKNRCNEVLVSCLVCHPFEAITRLWEDAAQGSSFCCKISSRNRLSSLSLCATRINPPRLDRRSEFKARIRDNGDSKKTRREEFAGIVEDEQCATALGRVYEENDDCIIKPRRAGDMPASHNRPWITNEIENEN